MKQYDVLIVEDDLALCEALCDTLEIEGYRVISAKNGIEALSQLAKYAVRLVVSDVQMPVMDGFQLLQNIQQKFEQLPVLLMTAYGSIPKAVEAMQSGAADYLIKPFEAGMLVDKVASLITLQAPVVNERVVADESMKKLYALASKVARTDVTCCWKARAAPVRKCWPVMFIATRIIMPARSRPLIARRFRKTCWKRCCSVTRKARLPAPFNRRR
jgi:Response regulator containing CheY-like receiver, AAA-type ATPase, and DNA-binding domains